MDKNNEHDEAMMLTLDCSRHNGNCGRRIHLADDRDGLFMMMDDEMNTQQISVWLSDTEAQRIQKFLDHYFQVKTQKRSDQAFADEFDRR